MGIAYCRVINSLYSNGIRFLVSALLSNLIFIYNNIVNLLKGVVMNKTSLILVAGLSMLCSSNNNNVNKVLVPDSKQIQISFSYNFSIADTTWRKDTIGRPVSLDSSKSIWKKIKNNNGNNYFYISTHASWTEYSVSDSILVINDTVREVLRTVNKLEENGFNAVDTQFLITRENNDIVYFKTIDQIYDFANDSVTSKDTTLNFISINIDNLGLIQSAYYRPDGCVDDCNFGYNISSLSFINFPVRKEFGYPEFN